MMPTATAPKLPGLDRLAEVRADYRADVVQVTAKEVWLRLREPVKPLPFRGNMTVDRRLPKHWLCFTNPVVERRAKDWTK
jgi:hypothetical protein